MKCEKGNPITESEAISDWDTYFNHEKDSLSGALNCFCNALSEEVGFFKSIFKKFTTPVGESKICMDEFTHDIFSALVGISLGLFIVIMDEVLEAVSDILIDWIGFHSNSELAMRKKNIVFILTFLQSALLLILMFANFSGTGIPLIGFIIYGKFQDFNS